MVNHKKIVRKLHEQIAREINISNVFEIYENELKYSYIHHTQIMYVSHHKM